MRSLLAERGQVTIPKALRDRLGLKPGAELEFHEEEGRIVIEKAGDGDAIDAVYGKFGSRRRTDALLRKLRGGA